MKRTRIEEDDEPSPVVHSQSDKQDTPSVKDENETSSSTRESIPRPPARTGHQSMTLFEQVNDDDVLQQLAYFLCHHITNTTLPEGATFEIEGKLGLFIDKMTGQRVMMPVTSEAIMRADTWFKFEANLTIQQHHFLNQMLNDKVKRLHGVLKYKHTRINDMFYRNEHGKVRVSVDQKTGEVVPNGVIVKQNIADLNVYRPNHPLDFRISLNVERCVEMPSKTTRPELIRSKDRLTYLHELVQIDLTQVKRISQDAEDQKVHEIEVEYRRVDSLLAEQTKFIQNEFQPNEYKTYLRQFLNTIRSLSERVRPMRSP